MRDLSNQPRVQSQKLFEGFERPITLADIVSVPLDRIPQKVMDRINFLRPISGKGVSESLFLFRGPQDIETWVEKQTVSNEQGEKYFVQLVDSFDGNVLGWGGLIYDPGDVAGLSMGYPHIALTGTLESNRRKGLGLRRLEIMGMLSSSWFHLPLRSDDQVSYEAQLVWRRLVDRGDAQLVDTIKGPRFEFLSKRESQK